MTNRGRERLAWVAGMGLGGLFMASGALKLLDPDLFAAGLHSFQLGLPDPVIERVAPIVACSEVVVGAALFLPRWRRAAALLAAFMLAAFTAALASLIIRQLEVSCSCFGSADLVCSREVGACHIVRNAVMLIFAGIVLIVPAQTGRRSGGSGPRAPEGGVGAENVAG